MLTSGLAEFWPFDEGSGAVAHGDLGQLDLTLTGDRGPNDVDGCWNQPGESNQFGGAGSGSIPSAWHMLENVGDACTIAVDSWYGGWSETIDPQDSGQAVSGSDEFVRVDGEYVLSLAVSAALASPPPQDPSFNTHIYAGQGVGDGNGVDTFANQPPFASTAPYTFLIELVRVNSTNVRSRIYVGGAQKQQDGVAAWDPHQATLTIGGGSAHGIKAAAVWLRTLSDDEKADVFAAGSIPAALADDPSSLVDSAGKSALVFDFDVERIHQPSTVATPAGLRETRALCEVAPRRYSLPVRLATAAEITRLLAALRAARGGGAVRWRHPKDDAPGSAATAPLYRILNPGEAGLELTRTAGGGFAQCTLEMERV